MYILLTISALYPGRSIIIRTIDISSLVKSSTLTKLSIIASLFEGLTSTLYTSDTVILLKEIISATCLINLGNPYNDHINRDVSVSYEEAFSEELNDLISLREDSIEFIEVISSIVISQVRREVNIWKEVHSSKGSIGRLKSL